MTRYADLSPGAQADLDERIDEALGSSLWRYSEDANRIRETFVNTLSEQLTQLSRALNALSEPARDCLARLITRVTGSNR